MISTNNIKQVAKVYVEGRMLKNFLSCAEFLIVEVCQYNLNNVGTVKYT